MTAYSDRSGQSYPGSTVAAAALATLAFPVVSLIAALFLIGREGSPQRRGQLKMWALAAGSWLALQAAVAIVVFAGFASGGTSPVEVEPPAKGEPCVGGPKEGATARVDEKGNAVLPCEFGGTVTIRTP